MKFRDKVWHCDRFSGYLREIFLLLMNGFDELSTHIRFGTNRLLFPSACVKIICRTIAVHTKNWANGNWFGDLRPKRNNIAFGSKIPKPVHYSDVIMSAMASQITWVSTVCLAVCSGAHKTKHQSSASVAFVRGIHWWPVDSPYKGPVTWKMFPFDAVIM